MLLGNWLACLLVRHKELVLMPDCLSKELGRRSLDVLGESDKAGAASLACAVKCHGTGAVGSNLSSCGLDLLVLMCCAVCGQRGMNLQERAISLFGKL